ncbi:hypothetical protein K2X85_09140 [bacterium]|nr:hypothetical protein [bacterium]
MRFWISAIVGIVLLSGVSTALFLWNPDQFTYRSPKDYKPQPLDPFLGQKIPKFEFDTKRIEVPNVQQLTSGESVFHLRNEGESELQLRLGSKSCTCMAIRIDKEGKTYSRFAKIKQLENIEKQREREKDPTQKDKITEAVEGQGNINPASVVTLAPGETADFVIEWDSKDTVGVKQIGADVFSNDPRPDRKSVNFDVALNIVPELLTEPSYLSFGQLRENQKREETLKVFSMVHEDLTVDYVQSSHPSVSATIRPMNADEKEKSKAKSGFIATVTVDGRLPVGDMNERVMFKTNLKQNPELPIIVAGMVNGLIEVSPSPLTFGIVTGGKEVTKQVYISARGLDPQETLSADEKNIQLRVDEKVLPPDFVQAKVGRHQDSQQLWVVDVTIKPGSVVGKFHAFIPILDSKGEARVNVTAEGVLSGASSSP